MALDTREQIDKQKEELRTNTTWSEAKKQSVRNNIQKAENRLAAGGQVTSDSGQVGERETESFRFRSALPFTGGVSQTAIQYFDEDEGVTVNAPFGTYFEIASNGAVREKKGVPPRFDDAKLGPVRSDEERAGTAGGAGAEGGEAAGARTPFEDTAAFSSNAFKSLSAADQDFIKMAYGAFSSESEEQAQRGLYLVSEQ